MAKAFYMKLAASNLRRNRRMYAPYAVAVALMSGMFFIILNIVVSRSIANLSYGDTAMALLTIGIVVMTIFTVGYILYLNSFLIKRRKKEFGLYGVLGMERRHVARVIVWESGILGLGSLGLGLVFGMVFGRLAFLMLMRMLSTAKGSVFVISGWSVLITIAVFLAIFTLTTLYNLFQVRLANPIDLLHGGQKGEKKVRFPLLLTLLGAGMLGYAYYMAISVRNPGLALLEFWPAVILVILATWLLFTGGSVFILGLLRKSKRIYYRPRNFIAISGLIHRMKQNAAGLANICILSTMVMVTVACCCALYLGQDTIVRVQNPNDISLRCWMNDLETEETLMAEAVDRAEQLAAQHGLTIENTIQYYHTEQNVLYINGRLIYHDEAGNLSFTSDMEEAAYRSVEAVLLSDYNALTGADVTLAEGETLLLADGPVDGLSEIAIEGGTLQVREVVQGTPFTKGKNSTREGRIVVVVPDKETADRLVRAIDPMTDQAEMHANLAINLDADPEAGMAYAAELKDWFRREAQAAMEALNNGRGFYRTEDIFQNRIDGYSLYGGLLFMGVFFSLLFLINTVLIIYFKQISEGFDDCERFEILQKVGLSDQEVRSTINRQMLIVFLLPLVVALVHIFAASNMIRQMLASFMLTDFMLTLTCIVVTALVFIVVYLCVYRITARTYYRLVKW